MCGIYGYIGKNAYDKVINGLNMIKYRGYDSCGIAYYENEFKIKKTIGDIEDLKNFKNNTTIAFGHTRWATNGSVTLENAHPHKSYDNSIIIVHNGIITNSDELKNELLGENIPFISETDTEVIANYIAYNRKNRSLEEVLKSLYEILEGNFSLLVAENNGDLYLLKRSNPLNVLKIRKGIVISSDIASLESGKLYSLKDNDIIKISKNKIKLLESDKINFIQHNNIYMNTNLNGYMHYMEKEIFETPIAIKNTFEEIKDSKVIDIINNFSKFTLIGCGTAYHACLMGEFLFKNKLLKETEAIIASNYSINKEIETKHLHIIVSQSGETADCIKVAEQVKKFGGKLLVITNEKLSVLAKMADYSIFTNAEKEVAIASTKTYCCQIFVFAYISKRLEDYNYKLNIDEFVENIRNYISNINIDQYAHQLHKYDKLIMIAKGIDYLTIYEACLKIRETDYIFTLPMYAGELKHGTIALIDKNAVVLSLNTNQDKDLLKTTINSIMAREGKVIDISNLIETNVDDYYKPIYSIIPFQLLSYKIAVINELNPDKPRNLSKSVTVE